jgi:hypothetical protein
VIREFLRALTARWFITMSGPLGVPAAAVGAFLTTGASRVAFIAAALAALVFTAYWVWRGERLQVLALQRRLEPRLSLSFISGQEPFVARTTLNTSWPPLNDAVYVRVLARCNSQVDNCRGVLKRVLRLVDSEWRPTAYREPQSLIWANFPDPADRNIRIDGGIDQYLDVFVCSVAGGGIIRPTLVGMVIPNHAVDVFKGGGTFQFDIAVAGDGNARAELSLRVSTGDKWDAFEVTPA